MSKQTIENVFVGLDAGNAVCESCFDVGHAHFTLSNIRTWLKRGLKVERWAYKKWLNTLNVEDVA